jgi:hypothetical protein
LNLHHKIVHRILTEELGWCKANFKWIPHCLTESQKQERVRISMELLRFLEEFSPQKVANRFTGDESWFYLENPRNSMWLASEVPWPTRVKRKIGVRKVMIWICFSTSINYGVVMLPSGERFNRDFFLDELFERYDEHQSETRRMNWTYDTFADWQCPSESGSIEIWLNEHSPNTPSSS